MTAWPTRRLAWATWTLAMAFSAAALFLLIFNRATPVGATWGPRAFSTLFALAFGTVGALIASRQSHNLIGWLFCWVGLLSGFQAFSEQYAVYAVLTRPGSLPGGEWAAWLQAWIWVPAALPAWTLLRLLFPAGRFTSAQWRGVAWLGIGGMAATVVGLAFRSGPLENFVSLANPLGYAGAQRALNIVYIGGYAIISTVTLAGALSLILRLRGSTGERRAQIKWFVYAVAFLALTVPFGLAPGGLGSSFVIVGTMGVPVSVGIAILRYRLYDIDVLIRRTLVYSVLTALLVLIYFGSVIILQAVFRAVAGGNSQLAVVASTLAIAALFAPLRRRVQAYIDRRFYRRKYDAARTLADFAATARDETDLDRLAGQLVGVVQETVQPASVSLWLRAPREAAR